MTIEKNALFVQALQAVEQQVQEILTSAIELLLDQCPSKIKSELIEGMDKIHAALNTALVKMEKQGFSEVR